MFLSLKNGSMVLAAVCAFAFTATAHAAAPKSLTQKRQAMELAKLQSQDINDERTTVGASYKAAKSADANCALADKSSRNDVAVIAKANTGGGKSSGGAVSGENSVR